MAQSGAMAVIKSMRPRQWLKNLLLFAGLYFAGKLLDPPSVLRAVAGFGIFCMLSGAVYLLNDVMDAPRDRLHPKKRLRPIASGALKITIALQVSLLCTMLGMAGAFWLSPYFGMCALSYMIMMTAYSLALKEVYLIDTLIIALGFIIRAVSGVIVLRTPTTSVLLTPWFVICVMFLSLLIAFCKRYSESVNMSTQASSTRAVLACYTTSMLDKAIAACAAGAIMSYALYATYTSQPWVMLTTLPFVIFGIFRYMHLVYNKGEGEAPESVVSTDGPLIVCVLMWGLSLIIVYFPLQ
jgi:4-hydroxybenzoate polyprenyltransferase